MESSRTEGRLASHYRILGLAVAAIAAAVVLACIVATVTFPLFAGLGGRDVTAAVATTALVVALPIVIALTSVIARVHDQKRDLAAREQLFVTAQQIGKFGYWHYNIATKEFTLSDKAYPFHSGGYSMLSASQPRSCCGAQFWMTLGGFCLGGLDKAGAISAR